MSYEAELQSHYAGARHRLMYPANAAVEPRPVRPRRAPIVETVQVVHKPRRTGAIFHHFGLAETANSPYRWRGIVDEVCGKHQCSYGEILGTQRNKRVVAARHEVFYRLSKETSMSLPRIGKFMGGKDHTSVMHGIAAHAKRIGALQ